MEMRTKEETLNSVWKISPGALPLVIVLSTFVWLIWPLSLRGGVPDFSIFYTAAGLIIQGDRTQLFNMQAQFEFQHRVLGMNFLLPFNHLAYESLLFLPLGLLPFSYALWVWRLWSVGMLLVSVRLLGKVFRVAQRDVFLLSLSFLPVMVAICHGQDSMLLLMLVSASLTRLMRNQDRIAGTLLASALFKPHLIIPIAAVLMWKRRTRFTQGFLGCSVILFLISSCLTGLKGWKEFAKLIQHAALGNSTMAIGGIPKMEPNLRGILALSGLSVDSALLLAIFVGSLLCLVAAWKLPTQYSAESLFPPLAALTLLVSVHVNPHDVSMLLIAIIAMLAQRRVSGLLCATVCLLQPLVLSTKYSALYALVILAAFSITTRDRILSGEETNLKSVPVKASM